MKFFAGLQKAERFDTLKKLQMSSGTSQWPNGLPNRERGSRFEGPDMSLNARPL
jgi:hypothetical protein